MKLLKLTGLVALVLAVALMLQVQPAAYADDGYRARYSHHGQTKYIDDDAHARRAYGPDRYRDHRTHHPRYRPAVPPGHMSPPGLRRGHDRDHRQWKHRGDRYDHRYDRDHRWRHPRDRYHRSDDDWDVTIHKDRRGTDVDIRYRKWDW